MNPPVRTSDFRKVLGHLATGLSVLTAPGPVGMTIQAMMSLSLNPPLVALGIRRASREWPDVRRAPLFRLNLLDRGTARRCSPSSVSGNHDQIAAGARRTAGGGWTSGPNSAR
ncbi:flavin reductase family protein [Micromonospora sp. Llam7]|uniref:flavin reductase family protein n=1 Tax=Micromonospora tarapacensis TaxID=2835305 RepID=UPI001C82EAF8|nr:flavin reductase family protein [Micromonospora tarapacensis]MBX7268197.1 flavin reductase family protein [Micromonospora tarapacensis]